MNTVGIIVSKGRGTVTIRGPGDEFIPVPRDYRHTQSSINDLIAAIKSLVGMTKVCTEHIGRYYKPIAPGFPPQGSPSGQLIPPLLRNSN